MKKILYIGNKISKHGFNKTSIETLGVFLKSEGYEVYFSSSKKNQFLRLMDMIWAVLKYSKKVDFILIDTYSTSSFWYAFFCSQIARIFRIKYISILHGGNLPYRLKNNLILSRMVFRNAYKNIAPSNYLKFEFEKTAYNNLIYIPNSIVLENYTFKKRESFSPNLLWVRAFAAIYNPNMAIFVLKELQKTYPQATLTMVGPDKDGSLIKAKELAKKLGVVVKFTGKLSKEEWCKLAFNQDVFINTTHFDNTPISVMEAMALGLPVVTTNVGGIPFLLTHNENAILVDDNDVNAMSEAIGGLVSDNEKTKQLAFNARIVVEKMDWNFVKKDWDLLFN